MVKPLHVLLMPVIAWALLAKCGPAAAVAGAPEAAARPLAVVVSIPPLKGIVEGLLPPGSTVESLIPPGVSEHGYEIPPAALARAARADIVVTIGLGLEPAVEKFLAGNPSERRREVVFHAVAKGRAGGTLPAKGDHDHEHEHNHAPGEHTDACNHRADIDPHFWLDPVLVGDLSTEVSRVIGLATGDTAAAAKALRTQLERIDGVHRRYAATIATAKRRTIVVAHDAWQYPASRFGLRVVAIAGLNAQEPTPEAIREAARVVRDEGLTRVFVEPQLSRRAAERIAQATGATVAILDPLGNGDWFALMEQNLAAIAEALNATLAPATSPTTPIPATPATPSAPSAPAPAAPTGAARP